MERMARRFFTIGSVGFIVIGALHTVVHLMQLSGPQLEMALRTVGGVPVMGAPAEMWDLWQGVSLLMGLFSMALGASNLAGLHAAPAEAFPARGVCAVNVAMLACVTLVGTLFLGPLQVLGGPFGMLMFGLPIWWSLDQPGNTRDPRAVVAG